MTRKIFILILLTITAAAFFFHKANNFPAITRYVKQPEKVSSPTSSVGTSKPSTLSSESEAAVISKTASLRSNEEPLTSAFEDLKHQAIRGNSAASCRLAVELQRCANGKRALEVASLMTQSSIDTSNMADQMLKTNEALASLCDGVTPEMLTEAYGFQKMAAQSGGREHLKWLIVRPEIDQQNFLNNLDAWADYRQRADAYVRSALIEQRGDDLELLLNIYAPVGAVISRPPYRIEDNVTFLALLDVGQRRGLSFSPSMLTVAQSIKQSLTLENQVNLTKKSAQLNKGFSNPDRDAYLKSVLPPDEQEFCR